ADAQELASARLHGRVTDQAGRPLSGASVAWTRSAGAAVDLRLPTSITTDATGRYELALRFEAGEPLVLREMSIECGGYIRATSEMRVELEAGNIEKRDFTLAAGKVLAGTLKAPSTLEQVGRSNPKPARRQFVLSGDAIDDWSESARTYWTA